MLYLGLKEDASWPVDGGASDSDQTALLDAYSYKYSLLLVFNKVLKLVH